jgi:hypothetical protein
MQLAILVLSPRRDASSCRTDWLSAEVETPRCLAAAAKLRWRATAMNELRALSGVKAIVKVLYAHRRSTRADRALSTQT